jgi:predicted Fe-S protein YdhL (DUF1289 family)
MIESPCINICRYDSKGYCYGCKRSYNEISNWIKYTDKERAAIIKELPKRKNAEKMPKDLNL